jgi:Short C-terminal domain
LTGIYVVLFILIFWVFPVVVGYQIGQRRGREGWAWGLLLGWIGVFMVAVLSPKNTRECPWCREPVRVGAGVCPHCQREIPVDTTAVVWKKASADERPTVAQKRLDEAAEAVAAGDYPKAFSSMYDESYEADRRGDLDALETLVRLATKIEEAPKAHERVKRDAHELVERLGPMIDAYQEPEPSDEVPLAAESSEPATAPPAAPDGSALDIARKRYARGEITREEFQQLRADLA